MNKKCKHPQNKRRITAFINDLVRPDVIWCSQCGSIKKSWRWEQPNMIKLRIVWETEFDFDPKDNLSEILKLVKKQTEEDPILTMESNGVMEGLKVVECIPIIEE